jgi:polyhydroxybutyrate depolymerase
MWRWMGIAAGLALALAGAGLTPGSVRAQSACQPSLPEGRSVQTLSHDDMERSYILVSPPLQDGAARPLVLSLHGFASNALQQEEFSRWGELALEEGFVAVFPQGEGFPPRWNAGVAGPMASLSPTRTDDTGFLRALIDELVARACVDPSRVYINGLSNGGGMSNRMACEAADVIAAAGGVAGAYSDFGPCEPTAPVPFIVFHGTADPIVPYTGQDGYLPDIETWAAGWAARNGCEAQSAEIFSEADTTAVQYAGCEADASVELYTIDGGGHTWPGGPALPEVITGRTSDTVDATALMWAFFQQFTRQGAAD